MEKILRIEDTTFSTKTEYSEQTFEGFVITTDEQTIKIGIDNSHDCCESWGHFASADSLDDFIGAKLTGISVVDTALNARMLEQQDPTQLDGGDIMYVNLDTDRGILQFAAYNSHNGYYGHTAIVVSEQLQHKETL